MSARKLTSSDDSSSDNEAYRRTFNCPQMNAKYDKVYAKVIQGKPSKVPILSAGTLTPEVLHDFVLCCQNFFLTKNVESADEVRRAMVGFEDERIRNWIGKEREALLDLTFEDFVEQLREKFLEPNWARRLRSDIYKAKLDEPRNFLAWATRLEKMNIFLGNNEFDDDTLIELMESGLPADLEERVCDANPPLTKESVHAWIEAVQRVVDAHQKEEKMALDMVKAAVARMRKKVRYNRATHGSSSALQTGSLNHIAASSSTIGSSKSWRAT